MTDKNILGRINSMTDELPKSERMIAEVILSEPEEIVHMTASELGKRSQTSAATVIRLCKRVGIPSFTQLKVLVSREVTKDHPSGYSDITPNEPVEDIMDKLLGNAFQTMQDTVSMLKEETLLEVIETLKKASVIYVYGVGASNLVAQDIAHKWSRIGKTCISLSDPHQLIAAMTSQPNDVVFFGISNSGETPEVVKLMERAKENGCKTIGLSRFGKNAISTTSDISLQHVRANEEEIRSAATSSLHAQFITVDILFFLYSSKNHQSVMEQIKHSRQEIEKYNG
jgi:DNA-binding MurR/RpiR family transcriptional regulator